MNLNETTCFMEQNGENRIKNQISKNCYAVVKYVVCP